MLRELVRDLGAAGVAELLPGGAARELARLLPEFGEPAGSQDAGEARARLFEQMLILFERLAEAGLLVLVIEDMHWADQSTRDLLAGAARTARLEPSPITLMSISPPPISTSARVGSPASKIRAAPCIRLASPQVMSASCSAKAGGISSDRASSTPSADTTTACATSGTRVVKLVTSQFRSRRYA